MNDAREILNSMFEAYKHRQDYKDDSMVEIMCKREKFEQNLDDIWRSISFNAKQIMEYKKAVRQIKEAGLVVMRNSIGKHKIVFKK